jgi:hypothetical protein
MSKHRKPRPAARLVQKSIFGGFIQARSDEAIQRDVFLAMDANDYRTLPREVTAGFGLDRIRMPSVAGTAQFCDTATLGKPVTVGDRSTCSMTEDTFRDIVKQAMAAGFVAALVKYQKQLAGVPALSRFYGRQEQSQRQGRETQIARKQTRAAQAVALAKSGKSTAEIVMYFRANGMPTCQRSTVYRWLKNKSPRSR